MIQRDSLQEKGFWESESLEINRHLLKKTRRRAT